MKIFITYSIIVLSLFFSIYEKAEAQAPSWAWAHNAIGNNEDYGNSIATDLNGNVYVTGYFKSDSITFGNVTLTNSATSYSEFFIAKYDALGNVVWAKSAVGSYYDYGTSIAVDSNGNVYATGYFSSDTLYFDGIMLTSFNSYDIFIVKYDSNGNIQWAKSTGGNGDEEVSSIAVDNNQNIYLTGYFGSDTLVMGSSILINSGFSDCFIAKYDAFGNNIWAKSVGSTYNEYGYDIAVNTSGDIYVIGSFESDSITFGNITITNPISPVTANFIAKYNATGNVVWAKKSGVAAGKNYLDSQGNLYITGSLGGDYFLGKYDSSGTAYWTKSFGNSMVFEAFGGICVDANGNVFAAGKIKSPVFTYPLWPPQMTMYGLNDILIVKYDIAGNFQWYKHDGGSSDDNVNGIAMDAEGNAYITGSANSPTINFDGSTLTNSSDNFYIAKLYACNTKRILNAEICYNTSYTSPSGNHVWSVAGTYYDDTIPNAQGCDSLIIINLTVIIPDTSVTQNGNILTANATGTNYQWLNCNNGFSPVNGDTVHIFTANGIGSYAVEIEKIGCRDTSSCYMTTGAVTLFNMVNGGIDTTCTGYFFDSGGAAGEYSNNENIIYTLCATAGNNLTLTFDSFLVEYQWDTLLIYNGVGTTSPFIGAYGITSPGIITSTNGCLTFRFTSDASIVMQGWQASISCFGPCSSHYTLYPDTITPHNWFALNQAAGVAPITYSWDWGDSTTSTGAYPSHTYTNPGYYNICLTITDSTGCSSTYCDSSTYINRGDNNVIITVNVVPQIPTSIAEFEYYKKDISIAPNPATNYCNITANFISATLLVYDIAGRVLLQQPFNISTEIDLSTLSSGVYFVEVKDREGRSVKGKVVKE